MYACICTEVCISACTEVDLYVYVCHVLPVQCLSANPRTNMRTHTHLQAISHGIWGSLLSPAFLPGTVCIIALS